jgi:hypothetical protein
LVPDPATIAFIESLRIAADGSIQALNDNGRLLIQVLRLDNEDHTRFRHLILKTLRVLAVKDWETFVLWMGYPTDLPALSELRPPQGNTRPNGIDNSFFARRSRGELEETYE